MAPERLHPPSPCSGWDAQQVIDHVIAGNQMVQTRAGLEPPPLPTDLVTAHAMSAAAAHRVFAAPDGLTRRFDLPFGTIPGSAFIGLRIIDALTHAWDLATATGSSTDLDPELAAEALAAAEQRMGPLFRGEGRPFNAEHPCSSDRPGADQLAAFLGRVVD